VKGFFVERVGSFFALEEEVVEVEGLLSSAFGFRGWWPSILIFSIVLN
jgi:hypothetical protein